MRPLMNAGILHLICSGWLAAAAGGSALAAPVRPPQIDQRSGGSEETGDYFAKWLSEDVAYIITDEERAVFRSLTTPAEKEQFIEQFWFRRDPDPLTTENEFKEEHYRRIAYANERFSSGCPGWMSDRGRVYVIHGPPAEVEAYPMGGVISRPMSEGGGSTTAFPFEIWRYRHIEGVGDDVLLEFVDASMTGEYRLAHDPDEKDALLFTSGSGETLAEVTGLSVRAGRPRFSGRSWDSYPLAMTTSRDNPFLRYETLARVQAPPPVKYRDLKEVVQVRVDYDNIPISTRTDYFRLNDSRVLVPITIQVSNLDLTFRPEGGSHVARVALYGIVTSLSKRVVTEFEDDLITSYPSDLLGQALTRRSILQKQVVLEPRTRYRLDLVIKDLASGRAGVTSTGIIPPALVPSRLAASSVILADALDVLDRVPDAETMFVIGDVRARPKIEQPFARDETLGVYFQIYNAALDQASHRPALTTRYRVVREGRVQLEELDETGASIQYFSEQRVVFMRRFSLRDVPPGRYDLSIEVGDRLTGQALNVTDRFEVVEPKQDR
jgi:GWxTD domain-containing protein